MKRNTCTWTVTDADGVTHEIGCIVKSLNGPQVIVDGDQYSVQSVNTFINVVDYPVDLPGTECHVVMIGKKARLAVNGIYTDDETAYEPVSDIPAWIWGMVGISFVSGLFVGSLWGAAVGVIFGMGYITAALQKKNSKAILLFVLFVVLCIICFILRVILESKGVFGV
ncbi:MAG: hypothetical protein J1F41_05280 [Lachnospiraceae bacterium]|nr:hypothetical protein [Lachnospiraceae bacterium]